MKNTYINDKDHDNKVDAPTQKEKGDNDNKVDATKREFSNQVVFEAKRGNKPNRRQFCKIEKQTTKSSGSSAGGGGSNLPIRKCSIPVQATITPSHMKIKNYSGKDKKGILDK